MIEVLIVDDDPMVRRHLTTILETDAEIQVVGAAEDGAEAVEMALRLSPDVVLMDLRMPTVDGITATEQIARHPNPPAVIALTTFDSDVNVVRALQVGAQGFLVKSTPPEDLLRLIRVAADGNGVLSPVAMQRLIARAETADAAQREAMARIAGLTERERDIAGCLGLGLSNGEIAARLFLSEATVKSYISRLLDKLQVPNRAKVGLLAQQAGLVGLDGE
ncbi:response regulator transcription factor [Actinoallomurus vinaceus]|uniref:Response regulator transcription factor n=1 Tax=Actinoallomurus vinaceus TaxID=1080074 RepID=A0ABP8UR73_9ACTN